MCVSTVAFISVAVRWDKSETVKEKEISSPVFFSAPLNFVNYDTVKNDDTQPVSMREYRGPRISALNSWIAFQ